MDLQKVITLLLAFIAVVLLGVVLDLTQTIVLPFVVAMLLSFILFPLVKWLTKWHIPRGIAIGLVILMLFGFFYLIGMFLYTSAQSLLKEYPVYQGKIQAVFIQFSKYIAETLNIPFNISSGIDWGQTLRGYLVFWTGNFMNFFSGIFIVTIFLIFILLEEEYFKARLKKAFPSNTSRKIRIIMEHINNQIGKYLAVKLGISVVTGFLVWLTLGFIGLDFPILWGFLAVILNFIPSLGSIVVVALASFLAYIQFASFGRVLAVLISLASIQMVLGNFVEPRIQGQRLNLSPVVILFSLLLWGYLWGIMGMIIAVPLAVTIKIVCENVPGLYPISILMGTGKERKRDKRAVFRFKKKELPG